ncbi:hypothetical protein VPH35_049085 [Triticum aestivum]|uniref:Uncharacterized protein n=1 Tax=Triticum aestivum TaxID=4565 RepID=A0A077RPH6_WHEAT|nr:unnamed protein product [Triticum aestivum]
MLHRPPVKRLSEMVFGDSSSAEEEEEDEDFEIILGMTFNDDIPLPTTGSQFGIHINRDRAEGHAKIMRGYFDPKPMYPKKYFRRHFWMHPSLFLTIAKAVE